MAALHFRNIGKWNIPLEVEPSTVAIVLLSAGWHAVIQEHLVQMVVVTLKVAQYWETQGVGHIAHVEGYFGYWLDLSVG